MDTITDLRTKLITAQWQYLLHACWAGDTVTALIARAEQNMLLDAWTALQREPVR